MRYLAVILSALLGLAATTAEAGQVRYVVTVTTEWVEVGDSRTSQSISTTVSSQAISPQGSERFVSLSEPVSVSEARQPAALAQFGPFRVVDGNRAALVGVTDAKSPGQFAAMLQAYPGITTLEMIECPGTAHDRANLRLGRMIRAAGIATHVPQGGSVRSGAVELFLAGTSRTMDDGAEFAVHSWMDIYGRQAGDFSADAPQNRAYLDYYRDMGMTSETAKDFYAMTNSVPFSKARWLDAAAMRQWTGDKAAAGGNAGANDGQKETLPIIVDGVTDSAPHSVAGPAPKLAYLDLSGTSF
ncbi:MAG: alpha/beta hydrolase [Sphingomonadaceae bacterium]